MVNMEVDFMKKLTRSRNNKMIAGVCGGIGDFFGVDPNLIRILFVILGLFSSTTSFIVVYIVCAIVIPEDDGVIYQDDENYNTKDNSILFMGIGLILLGTVLLAKMFLPIDIRIIPSIKMAVSKILNLWPALLIVLGVYILINQK